MSDQKVVPVKEPADANSSRFLFSVSDLLWLAVLMAASIQFIQLAFDVNPASGFAPFCSVFGFFVLLPIVCGRRRLAVVMAVLLGLVSLVAGFNWYSIVYALLIFAIFLVSCFLKLKPCGFVRNSRWVAGALVVAVVAGGILMKHYPPYFLRSLQEAQTAYPIVNLQDRLAAHAQPVSLTVDSANAAELLDRLDESYLSVPDRIYSLEKLHSAEYEKFVHRIGFGAVRMRPISSHRIDIPEIVDVSFNGDSFEPPTGPDDSWEDRASHYNLHGHRDYDESAIKRKLNSETDVLVTAYTRFLNASTFGSSPRFQHSAGFAPHAFRAPFPTVKLQMQEYRLNRLELVSLINYETPRVYVLDHLPRMDQLSEPNIQTRELDSFERAGLKQLVAGETLVVERNGDRFKMLGGVHAIAQCAQCHDSDRGGLLGAFSYEFVRSDRKASPSGIQLDELQDATAKLDP